MYKLYIDHNICMYTLSREQKKSGFIILWLVGIAWIEKVLNLTLTEPATAGRITERVR